MTTQPQEGGRDAQLPYGRRSRGGFHWVGDGGGAGSSAAASSVIELLPQVLRPWMRDGPRDREPAEGARGELHLEQPSRIWLRRI